MDGVNDPLDPFAALAPDRPWVPPEYATPEGIVGVPLMPLNSGYVTRKADELPLAGESRPWQMPNNYAADIPALRYGRIDDGVLAFD